MDRTQVINELHAMVPDLIERFGIESIGVFGSFARETARAESDLDLLVRFRPDAKVSLFTLARLANTIEERVGVAVDLIEDHPRLRASFRRSIEQDLIRVA